MKIDVQKFMELREMAKAREQRPAKAMPGHVAQTAKNEAKETKPVRTVAMDLNGSMEERVSALRERSAEGLPVRELGNFIDVRA